MDVLVVLPGFGFGGWRVEGRGEGTGFEEACGLRDSVDGLRFLVFFPCGPGYVAADDGFEGEDLEASDLHGAGLEEGDLGGGNGGGEREG